jgi:hypothetical protein
MSLFLKTNPVGIDKLINTKMIQLSKKLELFNIDIYGRLYELDKKRPFAKIEANSLKNNYADIFNDDSRNICAFIVSNNETISGQNNLAKVQIDVVFTLNLDKILTSKEREDEEIKLLAFHAVNSALWNVVSVKKTIPEIFSNFDISDLKIADYHPYFNFSFQCEVFYNLNECVTI